jgi:hypothetical protein
MSTLTNKFSYDSIICNIPINEFIINICSIDDKDFNKLLKKSYTYDVYVTVISSVSELFLKNKEDIKLFLRGSLDSEKYISIIHEELAQLYICYKNTSIDDKIKFGFCKKNIKKSFWDDIYTTTYYNLDDNIQHIYNLYIHSILHKITENILINGIENMNI